MTAYEQTFELDQNQLYVDSIAPRPRLEKLKVGQTWTFRTFAPFPGGPPAQVVQARFGVIYHPDHIGRLLRACGLSPQRPQRTAKERDDRRVRQWVQIEWPRVKKTPPAGGPSRLPR